MRYRLSESQREFYQANGYLIGLPAVYTTDEIGGLNRDLPGLFGLLRPGETTKDIREWHESSRFLYDICTNPQILEHTSR